jgi:hypothetical protein
MHWWSNFMTRLTAATKAFQKPDIITDPLNLDADFNSWDSRRLRYDINWAFYENTVYDEIASRNWPKGYKTKFGLYRYIRPIYNPSYRLGEFWKAHLWAGALADIPLVFPEGVNDEDLQAAIMQIWQWSNWEVKKDIVPLYGSVMGDVGILIVDDTLHDKVFFDIVHPGNIAAVELDAAGNVKGYEIQEERPDPRAITDQAVTYSEIATRDGEDVIYTTLLDGKPWAWNEIGSSWTRPYGFVPMVLIQHNNVGLEWGWSEIHPGQSEFREVDDSASILNDQIRKTVNSGWLFSGVTKPENSPTAKETSLTGPAAALNRPQPGREEVPIFYGPEGARATPLVADLDIQATISNIAAMNTEIERDYPELRVLALDEAGGNISGRALRLARQPAETKVNQRRPGYYNALVRAQQMAVAIAGFNGYEAFGGFDLNSFDQGLLDHSIGQMPIFAVDPLDDLEISKETATIIKLFTDAGAGIEQAALRAGLTEDEAAALARADLSILER